MSVVWIRAHIACDGCDEKFSIDLDEAYRPPHRWSLFDIVEDALRGGPEGTIQGGLMLCRKCTRIVDEDPSVPEDRSATHDEVTRILSRAPTKEG